MAAKKTKRPKSAATEAAGDFPKYFIVQLQRDSGVHYVACEAIVSVNSEKLPAAIRRELETAFDIAVRDQPMRVMGLPMPSDEYGGWIAFQMSLQMSTDIDPND
jgi:hypothetical protein